MQLNPFDYSIRYGVDIHSLDFDVSNVSLIEIELPQDSCHNRLYYCAGINSAIIRNSTLSQAVELHMRSMNKLKKSSDSECIFPSRPLTKLAASEKLTVIAYRDVL